MQLPFTEAEFFDVFAAYNAALWPAAAALWLLSLAGALLVLRGGQRAHRGLSALLAVHWACAAVAYHALFFARINPAAWLFAGMFLLQAALFVRVGIVQSRLRFSAGQSARFILAATLVVYALAYPVINWA